MPVGLSASLACVARGACAVKGRGGAPGLGRPPLRRCFGWAAEDTRLSFKVKADNFNVQKLAGGLFLRCEQRHETLLEPMGSKSVYNCVKALVLANRFAEEALGTDRGNDKAQVARIGFVPSLARKGELQWMRLQVVAVGVRPDAKAPGVDVSGLAPSELKVGSNTQLESLQKAIVATWMQRCAGSKGDPLLFAMGDASVSRAVKGAAFALRELGKRRGGARPFVCFPGMEQVTRPLTAQQRPGEKQTVTVLRLEPAPAWGDRGAPILVRTAPEPAPDRGSLRAEGAA